METVLNCPQFICVIAAETVGMDVLVKQRKLNEAQRLTGHRCWKVSSASVVHTQSCLVFSCEGLCFVGFYSVQCAVCGPGAETVGLYIPFINVHALICKVEHVPFLSPVF